MIQSCDCQLPAMIEPLHSPLQHKSMSIISPEHIRHFPFLLVISMACRHIPIPPTSPWSFCPQTTKPGREMNLMCTFKYIVAHQIIYVLSHDMQVVHQLSLSLLSHTLGVLITAGPAITECVNGSENELKQRHTLVDLGVCVSFAYACAGYACSCIRERVSLCMHINIDGCVTERLVFLDNNLMVLCVPSPQALAASICWELYFSLSSPPPSSLGVTRRSWQVKGEEVGEKRRRKKKRGIQQDTNPTISGMRWWERKRKTEHSLTE